MSQSPGAGQPGRSAADSSAREGSGQEGSGQEGSAQEGSAQEGSAREGSGQEGSGQEGSAQEGSAQEGSAQDSEALDGNVLAGVLSEIFAADITSALGQCANCLRTGPLAEVRVYSGAVARCPGCAAVVLRIVRAPERAWLDMRGLRCVEFAVPAGQ